MSTNCISGYFWSNAIAFICTNNLSGSYGKYVKKLKETNCFGFPPFSLVVHCLVCLLQKLSPFMFHSMDALLECKASPNIVSIDFRVSIDSETFSVTKSVLVRRFLEYVNCILYWAVRYTPPKTKTKKRT